MPNDSVRPSYVARVVGFCLLAFATLVAAGCSFGGPTHTDPQLFTWNGALAAPGSLHLRSMNGAIDVQPSADDNVHVTASARWHRGNPKTDVRFNVVSAGGDVTICLLWTRGACTANRPGTANHKWSFSKFFRRGTDAEITLTVSVPTRVKVDASTLNGSVHVTSTAPVYARTMNGSILVATAIGPVDAQTMNGNVDIRMTTLGDDGPVRASSVNGSVNAYMPEKFDAVLALSAVNGSIGSDFAVTTVGEKASKHLNGTIGAGGRDVKVSTINGSAWLHKLNADGTVAQAPSKD